jgi:hypothetical protein
MVSGERPAGLVQVGSATRVAVALGRPVQGSGAPRVESPERVVRAWEMLIGINDELKLETLPPETVARVRELLKTVTAELQRSVSPALAGELRHLLGDDEAGASASEVRIQYASLLGWLGGLVVSMYSQLEGSKRQLLPAEHLGGLDGPGSGAGPRRPASGAAPGASRK